MNIEILTECGEQLGFGHLYRCLSLFQAIEERKIPVNLIVKSNSDLSPLLNNILFEYNNWFNNYNYNNNTIYIHDSISINQHGVNEICNNVDKIVFFDDFNRYKYSNSIVIDSTVSVNDNLNFKNLFDDVLYLLDTKYTALRKEFWNIDRRKVRESIKSLLITFGGSDVRNLCPKFLRLLVKSLPTVKKTVIVGPDFDNKSIIKNEADNNTELIFSPNSNQIKQCMINSDICIGSGGQTLYELASVGVPTIAIILGDNQVEDTIGWQKKGFLINAGWWHENNIEKKILNYINSITSKIIRQKMANIGQNSIDGNGSKRIVASIIEHFT